MTEGREIIKPAVPDRVRLDAAERLAARRRAQDAGVAPDVPAARAPLVDRCDLGPPDAERLARAYELLGIGRIETVREVQLVHYPKGVVELVVVRRRIDQGVAGERAITDRSWIRQEPDGG